MINPLNNALETLVSEQLLRTDRYRHECIHCVKLLGIPIDFSFCSCGIMGVPFPKGVTAIIECPKNCINYFKEEPCP
jgi:hypothetical protein